MTKAIIIGLLVGMGAWAQTGTPVRVSSDPPPGAVTNVIIVNGSSQTTAKCFAKSWLAVGARAITSVSVSSATNANPVVLTSTGHGFPTSSLPQVTISGATGNWTPINGTFTATVIDANTFSIPVDSTTFGALTGTVKFTTTAPRTGQPEWAVQKFAYDANGNVIWSGWLSGSSSYSAKCSDASVVGVNQQ